MVKLISDKELREIQLKILEDVANFCEEREIRYFLAYGTLIGAIRHHGYIPWDDDIDIAMPRPDYDRFVEEYHGRDENFEVVAYPKDKKYSLPFAKVHCKATIMDEYLYHQDCYGVYIDVFPFDGIKDAKQMTSAHRLRLLLNAKKAVLTGNRTFYKKALILIAKVLFSFVSVESILKKIDKIVRAVPYDEAKKVGYLPTEGKSVSVVFDKSLFENCKYACFEGRNYKIPCGYDCFLRGLYGDYMKFPPIEKQVTHHTFKAWWK